MSSAGQDLLIKNTEAFVGAELESQTDTDILIRSGEISQIGKGLDAAEARIIDGQDFFVTPGLVNAHFHPGQQLNRALGVGLSHDQQMDLLHSTDRIKQPGDRDFLAQVAVLEALKAGTTTFYSVGSNIEGQVELFKKIGVRAACTMIPKDIAADDKSDQVRAKTWETTERIEYARELHQKHHSEQIRIHFGVCNVRYASDELILGMMELADEFDVGFHMHAAESDEYVAAAVKRTGNRPVEHLHNLGALSDRVSLAHSVKLNPQEIEWLAESETSVVHCPRANSYVGVGVCPVPDLFRAGVNIALGSDAAINNNSNKVLGEALAVFQNLSNIADEHTLIDYLELFRMLTSNGAKALGLSKKIGAIKVGKQADLVLWNKNDLEFIPGNNYLADLIFVDGCRAHTVVVGGEVVLADYNPTRVNQEEIVEEAREIADRYHLAFSGLTTKHKRD